MSFDEMGARSKLTVTHLRGSDLVKGYEDHKHLGRREAAANYALVFMARGLTAKRKQAVGYFLSSAPAKVSTTKDLLMECVERFQKARMYDVAKVCDMGTTSQQAYRLLGVDKLGSFQCEGETVTALPVVPHPFKCIWNALVNYDISVDGKVAKWSHIMQLFSADKGRALRAVPKLNAIHVRPTAFKKMTVQFATQALRRLVAARC